MKHISPEFKASVLEKLLFLTMTITAVSQVEGYRKLFIIGVIRINYRESHSLVQNKTISSGLPKHGSRFIVKTVTLSETEIAEYCRKKGLYSAPIDEPMETGFFAGAF